MSEKNWLIRTKSNHILGPISKEKLLELYQNGSIKGDDEICSGNGFWFFIREENMVQRYLLSNEIQGFNPISEAKDVITAGLPVGGATTNDSQSDITLVGGVNLSMLTGDVPPKPQETTPAAPKVPATEAAKKKTEPRRIAKQSPTPKLPSAPAKKQSYLKYLGLLVFITLFCLIYFRKQIIRYFFQGEMTVSLSLISSAHAQEDTPAKKTSRSVHSLR